MWFGQNSRGCNALQLFDQRPTLLLYQMSETTGCAAALTRTHERQLRAACDDGPVMLDFNCLRNGQCIFKLNAKIPHRAVHFGVPEQ